MDAKCARRNCFFIRKHPSKSFNLRCRESLHFARVMFCDGQTKKIRCSSLCRQLGARAWVLRDLMARLSFSDSHFPPLVATCAEYTHTYIGVTKYGPFLGTHTHSPCARLGICRAVWEILHLIRDSLPKRIKLLRPKINSASQSRSNKAEFVGFQFSSQTQPGEHNLVLCHALEYPF